MKKIYEKPYLTGEKHEYAVSLGIISPATVFQVAPVFPPK